MSDYMTHIAVAIMAGTGLGWAVVEVGAEMLAILAWIIE
jgi:hypothetical protein